MILDKTAFTSSMSVVGDFNLSYIAIEYDDETKTLSIAGTNAQMMIVNEVAIKDEKDQEFCKKFFSKKNTGYKLPETLLSKKVTFAEFNEIDGVLTCNNTVVEIYDGEYPHWRVVIPTKNLQRALFYCGFNPDFVRQINKAIGRKGVGIAGDRPLVSVDENDPKAESLAPHLWNIIDEQERKQTVILMPLRLDF